MVFSVYLAGESWHTVALHIPQDLGTFLQLHLEDLTPLQEFRYPPKQIANNHKGIKEKLFRTMGPVE